MPRALSLPVRATLALYGLVWRLALHGLRRNARLREGWEERTLTAGPPPAADLWIQAASGGEAYLAFEIAKNLAARQPADCPVFTVLCTTFTSQGLAVLEQAKAALSVTRLRLVPHYFPFDLPCRMRRALQAVSPRAVLLLETEIWPGLLAACAAQDVPVLLLNGRMTESSLRGYLKLSWLWRALAPSRVLAVSDADAGRFAQIFGPATVGRMENIKFDRLRFAAQPSTEGEPDAQATALAALLPEGAPFVVFGSVRKEEQEQVLALANGLLEQLPHTVIGLFPRHMHHVEQWAKALAGAGLPFARRSALGGEAGAAQPGTVLLWDAFGELGRAFGLARTAFVGGTLAQVGGQNFLEPLTFGVVPVIGPSWSNFAWVGQEIFEQGLVRQAADWQGALEALVTLAAGPPPRLEVQAGAEAYARSRKGGAQTACQAVAESLFWA